MAETILITGVGRGIGRALASAAAARGDRVIGTLRDPSAAPAGIEPHRLDVTDWPALRAFGAALADRAVDLLVCNAGIYEGRGGLLDPSWTPEAWERVMRVNVTAVFFTVRACLPALRRAGRARIAIIGSQMGSSARARGGSYAYRASKAAAANLAANLAAELRPEGIAVGVYHPGWVKTDMGTAGAEIAPEASAAGLLARFAALSPERSGVFESWDGQALPF
jgi:NAD(P)-dependent dehydrogenase (short-subunit alcohol dehydrogenase family)